MPNVSKTSVVSFEIADTEAPAAPVIGTPVAKSKGVWTIPVTWPTNDDDGSELTGLKAGLVVLLEDDPDFDSTSVTADDASKRAGAQKQNVTLSPADAGKTASFDFTVTVGTKYVLFVSVTD